MFSNPTPLTNLPPRERILETALALFYAHGTRAVGIDRIIAESGVAKASFYRYFASKDDLVVAYLELRHARWMVWFEAALAARCAAKGYAMAQVAEVLREWFASPDFRGCAFINVSAEGLGDAALEVARAHKQALRETLRRLAKDCGHARPAAVSDEALLIVEGAILRAQMTAEPKQADVAARLLAKLA